MANILGLALKVTGDASGLAKSLTPVDRALENLAKQADRAAAIFEPLTERSAAAAKAQEDFAERFEKIAEQLRQGAIGPQEYAAAFGQLSEEAKASADAFEQGLKVIEQYRTEEEKRAKELERINKLLEQGAIDEDTATRAREAATAGAEKLSEAEKKLAEDRDAAAKIIEANLTAVEKAQKAYDEAAETALDLEQKGLLTKEQLADELERQQNILTKAKDAQNALSDSQKRADEIIRSQRSALEVFIEKQQEFQRLLEEGVLPLENYTQAVQNAARGLEGADLAAASEAAGVKLEEVAASSETATTQATDLAGIFKQLPGFLGRFSDTLINVLNNANQLGKELDNLQKNAAALAKAAPLLSQSLRTLTSPLGLLATGITVSGGIAAGLSALEGEAQRLTNTANKLGVSFRFIETLQQAARITGVSFEQVNAATTRLLRSLANADERSQKASEALEKLGVSISTLDEGDTEATIRAIATRLAGIEDPARKATAAVAIFGKSGAELLPFLSSLGEAEATLDRFNARLSELDRDRVLALGESFNAVGAALRGVGNEALTPFIGAVQAIGDGLAPVIAEFGRAIGNVLDAISPFTTALGGVINVLGQLVAFGLRGINEFFAPIAMLLKGLSGVIEIANKSLTRFFQSITPNSQPAQRSLATVRDTAEQLQASINKGNLSIDDAIRKAGQFGQTGFAAAVDFQRAVARLNSELSAIGSKEYERRLAEATKEFEKQLEEAKKIRGELIRIADAEEARRRESSQTADQIIRQQEALAEQVRQLNLVGGDEQRLNALRNRIAIEQEIFRVQEQVIAAREKNDQDAVVAAEARIQRLREALDIEGQRLSGERTVLEIENERLKTLGNRRKMVEEMLSQQTALTDQEQKTAAIQATLAEAEEKASLVRLQVEKEIEELAAKTIGNGSEFLRRRAEIIASSGLPDAERRVEKLQSLLDATLEQEAAAQQGFADGYEKAFEQASGTLDTAITKAAEFGREGVAAATQLSIGIANAQERAKAGIFTKDAYDREVARLQSLFEEQVRRLDELRARELQNRQAVDQARQVANVRVEDFLRAQLDERTQAELQANDQIAKRRTEALENVRAIQERIAVAERSVAAAREQGDLRSARARNAELQALRRAERIEQGIADGRANAANTQASGLRSGLAQAERFQSLVAAQNQNFLRSFNDTYGAANATLAAANAVAAEQSRRLELLRPVEGAVRTADIRTAEGAALVLGLGAAEQDPALIEARLQTRQLQGIRTAIVNAVQGYLNTPVEIL